MGLRRVDLARRAGLSQGYVGNVEEARPRINGRPSRPAQDVLLTWTHALSLDGETTRRILGLSGYESVDEANRGWRLMESSTPYSLGVTPEARDVHGEDLLIELEELVRRVQQQDNAEVLAYLRMTLKVLNAYLAR